MVGHNLFVISFGSESDKKVALEEGPWHFFHDLMILKQTKAMQTPSEVDFNEISLWVQCHNVPLECMEPDIITRIGGRIGKVEEVDVGEGGLCVGKFARVRVTRRLDKPLVRCVPLVHEVIQKEVLVLLQYERLPEFCFVCGRVGHISRDCWDEKKATGEFQYDSWLRAGRSFAGRRSQDTETGGSPRLALGRIREGGDGNSEGEGSRQTLRTSPAPRVAEGERVTDMKGEGRKGDEDGEGGESEVSGGRGLIDRDLMVVEREIEAEAVGEDDMAIVAPTQAGTLIPSDDGSEIPGPKDKSDLGKRREKGWKRRARMQKRIELGVGMADGGDDGGGVGTKRRGEELQKGGGEVGLAQKSLKLSGDSKSSEDKTAVAAMQSRRIL